MNEVKEDKLLLEIHNINIKLDELNNILKKLIK